LKDPTEVFEAEVEKNIEGLARDKELEALSVQWQIASAKHRYTYNFRWLGRPIIQYPQDLLALQELIWSYKPDAIVETGIAHGGSLVFFSSMLQLLGGDRIVVGIDIDIRPHNRVAIENHSMYPRIRMIEASSVDPNTADRVRELLGNRKHVLVVLDSNHTHEHVLQELRLYSPLVRRDGYLVVLDTMVEDVPAELHKDRKWGKGNNPKTAVWEFLRENERFQIEKSIEAKLQITVAPDGYLRCTKD
jgi:cephalosporin hydroxylase